jgi:hypothetical protein
MPLAPVRPIDSTGYVRRCTRRAFFVLCLGAAPLLAHAQAGQDAIIKRALVERQQQQEDQALRIRQSQQLLDARSRGASAQQLREMESRQAGQRRDAQSLNADQLLRLQILSGARERGAASAAQPDVEALRMQRERARFRGALSR